MEYTKRLSVLFMLSVVSCDLCGEKNLDEWFASDSKCGVGYNDTFLAIKIDSENTSNGLTPNVNPSCIKSKILPLASGGILKVKVYSKAVTVEDYLIVFVNDAENNVVGRETLLEVSDGWTDLEITLNGKRNYDGYVMLVGQASSSSKIMVGSICYIPAQQELLSEENSELTPQEAQDIAKHIDSVLKSEASVKSFWIFDEDFWTPLTISLAVIIPVVILALLSWACFAIGKRQGTKQQPHVYEDIDNLPKPYLVPRVTNVYAESITSSYGGRNNNNIYSV